MSSDYYYMHYLQQTTIDARITGICNSIPVPPLTYIVSNIAKEVWVELDGTLALVGTIAALVGTIATLVETVIIVEATASLFDVVVVALGIIAGI